MRHTQRTDTDLPPDSEVPLGRGVLFTASKVTSYDPATGSGDASFTSYLSGKCVGTAFVGSTSVSNVNSTGTFHFVASNGGKRVDSHCTTSVTDPVGRGWRFLFCWYRPATIAADSLVKTRLARAGRSLRPDGQNRRGLSTPVRDRDEIHLI